jgi:hypothetical protein
VKPLALLLFLGSALAQATWSVQSLIPNAIAIETPTTLIRFAPGSNPLSPSEAALFGHPPGCPLASSYPPSAFPACYPLDLPGGMLPLRVFSNAPGSWSVLLQLSNLVNPQIAQIPLDQVWVRVNGGPWEALGPSPINLYSGVGPTQGYQLIQVELALELTGDEEAGSYTANALITAVRQP